MQRTFGNRATTGFVTNPDVSPDARAADARHPALALQRDSIAALRAKHEALAKASAPSTKTPIAPTQSDKLEPPARESELQSVAGQHAQSVIDSVTPIEGGITSAVQSIAGANGGQLEGLDHKLKTVGSLQRKLADLARTRVKTAGETIEQAVAAEAVNTKDALRYTITVPPLGYAILADTKLREGLEAVGATRIKAANAWADPENSYKGFNSAYTCKTQTGALVKFEVQIHTPESWEMKSELHKQYEDARKETNMSAAAKRWLNEYMKTRWKGVTVPKGMEAYDAKMNKRP